MERSNIDLPKVVLWIVNCEAGMICDKVFVDPKWKQSIYLI
jgi:hypothetical protein